LYSFNDLRIENILLKEGFFHSYDFEGIKINFTQKIFNSNLQEITLNDIIKNKATLVLFIMRGCDKCIYDNIKKIKEFRHNSKLNVIIGIAGLDKRQFKSFVHNNKIKNYSYLIPDDYFSGFKINPVVYFVIDSSHNLKYFYAPNYLFSTLTNDYLTKIINIFSEN